MSYKQRSVFVWFFIITGEIYTFAFSRSLTTLKMMSVIFPSWNGRKNFTKNIASFTRVLSFNPRGVGKKRMKSWGEYTYEFLDSLPNLIHTSIRIYGGHISLPGLCFCFFKCFPAHSLQYLESYNICDCETSPACLFWCFPLF